MYERNINEGDKVYFDEENNLDKIQERVSITEGKEVWKWILQLITTISMQKIL